MPTRINRFYSFCEEAIAYDVLISIILKSHVSTTGGQTEYAEYYVHIEIYRCLILHPPCRSINFQWKNERVQKLTRGLANEQ